MFKRKMKRSRVCNGTVMLLIIFTSFCTGMLLLQTGYLHYGINTVEHWLVEYDWKFSGCPNEHQFDHVKTYNEGQAPHTPITESYEQGGYGGTAGPPIVGPPITHGFLFVCQPDMWGQGAGKGNQFAGLRGAMLLARLLNRRLVIGSQSTSTLKLLKELDSKKITKTGILLSNLQDIPKNASIQGIHLQWSVDESPIIIDFWKCRYEFDLVQQQTAEGPMTFWLKSDWLKSLLCLRQSKADVLYLFETFYFATHIERVYSYQMFVHQYLAPDFWTGGGKLSPALHPIMETVYSGFFPHEGLAPHAPHGEQASHTPLGRVQSILKQLGDIKERTGNMPPMDVSIFLRRYPIRYRTEKPHINPNALYQSTDFIIETLLKSIKDNCLCQVTHSQIYIYISARIEKQKGVEESFTLNEMDQIQQSLSAILQKENSCHVKLFTSLSFFNETSTLSKDDLIWFDWIMGASAHFTLLNDYSTFSSASLILRYGMKNLQRSHVTFY